MIYRRPTDDELASLPAHHGEILRAFEKAATGYGTGSYQDVAASLGIPIGTVKSRLNRARIALRQKQEKRDLEKDAQVTSEDLRQAVGGNG